MYANSSVSLVSVLVSVGFFRSGASLRRTTASCRSQNNIARWIFDLNLIPYLRGEQDLYKKTQFYSERNTGAISRSSRPSASGILPLNRDASSRHFLKNFRNGNR